eukprot:TCALIF_13853-PA protein Name:"Protein of unknown function" AED:0.30 eAED:0.30 QI:0/0.4/0.16/0.5/0.6/0.66/6/0/251
MRKDSTWFKKLAKGKKFMTMSQPVHYSRILQQIVTKTVAVECTKTDFPWTERQNENQSAEALPLVMISNKWILSLGLLVLANCVVNGEPEPRRRSKVPKIFNDSEEGSNKTSNSREGKVPFFVRLDNHIFPETRYQLLDFKQMNCILVFSLFNIVQFNNGGCRSSSTISGGGTGSTNRNGTCFTMNECVSKGGSAAGSCAAGFGVCCVFLVSTSGATVTQNCTYVRNPNFPNSLDTTSQISYNIQKCDRSK